ncbi:hypothetical protein CKAH01_16627 [Colletotrichum kahawae]|uniref:Uncharacterized protein n=1 Tax=Colletotrichum kahawae TaxID=34407 RepID=A0AAD9YEV5_COLKA|nr:hypothetical protein CKAH01_16627 [Colletotrichum kahawae]
MRRNGVPGWVLAQRSKTPSLTPFTPSVFGGGQLAAKWQTQTETATRPAGKGRTDSDRPSSGESEQSACGGQVVGRFSAAMGPTRGQKHQKRATQSAGRQPTGCVGRRSSLGFLACQVMIPVPPRAALLLWTCPPVPGIQRRWTGLDGNHNPLFTRCPISQRSLFRQLHHSGIQSPPRISPSSQGQDPRPSPRRLINHHDSQVPPLCHGCLHTW